MSSLETILKSAFAGTILASMLFGGYVVLACANVRLLLRKQSVPNVYLYFTILMFMVTSVYIGVFVYTAELELVIAPVDPQNNDQDAVWPSVVTNTMALLNILLSGGLLIYRCLVVWDDYRIAAIPALVFLGVFGTGITCVWAAGSPVVEPHTTRILNYPFWICIVVLNVLTTFLISFRLLQVRRNLRNMLGNGHGQHYVTIVAMLVESAALELIFAVLAFATFAADVTVASVFAPMEGLIVVIAPNMLIYRVAEGSSFEAKDSRTAVSQPTLKFVTNASRRESSPIALRGVDRRGSGSSALDASQESKSTLVSYHEASKV